MWRYKLRLDITRFHMRLKACAYAYRKKGMVILPRGNARYISSSVACVQLIQELVTLLFFHYITTLCGNTMVRLFFPSHHFYLFPMKINVTIFCSSSSSCCCFRLFICFFSFLIWSLQHGARILFGCVTCALAQNIVHNADHFDGYSTPTWRYICAPRCFLWMNQNGSLPRKVYELKVHFPLPAVIRPVAIVGRPLTRHFVGLGSILSVVPSTALSVA